MDRADDDDDDDLHHRQLVRHNINDSSGLGHPDQAIKMYVRISGFGTRSWGLNERGAPKDPQQL